MGTPMAAVCRSHHLAREIRRRRHQRGFSQEQLATLTGTTQSSIARLESGSLSPTLDTLDRIARALGTSLEVTFAATPPVHETSPRTRSSRPPVNWRDDEGSVSGEVELPLRLYWSDDLNRFDLSNSAERRLLYQTVLAEGTDEDVRSYLHAPTLLAIWDELWLPAAVRATWTPWIQERRSAAL